MSEILELRVLETLAGEARPVRLKSLGLRLGGLDASTVSRVTDAMASAGWIEKDEYGVKLSGTMYSLAIKQVRAEVEELLDLGAQATTRMMEVRRLQRLLGWNKELESARSMGMGTAASEAEAKLARAFEAERKEKGLSNMDVQDEQDKEVESGELPLSPGGCGRWTGRE